MSDEGKAILTLPRCCRRWQHWLVCGGGVGSEAFLEKHETQRQAKHEVLSQVQL